MFSAGNHVVYSSHGVCEITEIKTMSFGGETKQYYVLSPINDKRSTIFIPIDNMVLLSQMRPVLTKEEIDELLASVIPGTCSWIPSDSERKNFCAATIKSGDRLAILHMIEMLYLHRERMMDEKKHFHVTDERFLNDAEKMLNDEFAFVLGISTSEVEHYVEERVKKSS